MVFLDEEGSVLLPHRGADNVEEFAKSAQDVEAYVVARKAAAAGDSAAKIDMVLLELEHRVLTREEGETKLAGLGAPDDGQAQRRDRVFAELKAQAICEEAGKKVEAGDFAGAIADFTRATEVDAKSTAAFSGRANARRRYGDLDGSISDSTRAIELDPASAWGYYARGNTRYDAGAGAAALADYRKACELDPAGQLYARLGIWLLRAAEGEREAATEELRTFLAGRESTSEDEWYPRLARFLMGELSAADLFERAAAGDDSGAAGRKCDAYYYAGALRLIEGDTATAKDCFEKCVATGVKGYSEYASASVALRALSAGK